MVSKIKRDLLKQRGTHAFSKQLSEAGGTYSADEVSQMLGVTEIDVIEGTNRKLLGVQIKGEYRYPCWQFDGNKVVEHFSEIIVMLETNPISMIQFFLSTEPDINGMSPIEVLKLGELRQIKTVKLLAKQFQQHVAR